MISIIVPVYNSKRYLPRCIESICGQTYRALEIILVNDGSTDGSGQLCETYAQKDPRILVVHQENGGAVRARKEGLMRASGKYIAFADSDDWLEPHMLEMLHGTLTGQDVEIAMCGRYEETGHCARAVRQGIAPGRYDKEAMLRQVYPHMIVNRRFFEWGLFPGLWDKLFKRECLEKFLLAVDERLTMGDDAACVYPALLEAESIYIRKECLYHYRQSPASMVKRVEEAGKERERFGILYRTVLGELEREKDIYDLRGQWREYLLFLMVPRADTLLKGMGELPYLFPFPGIRRGSRVIVYGMGTYGQRLYACLRRSGFCEVVAAADRGYRELSSQGIEVIAPARIASYPFDAIAIAASFAGTREAIYQELSGLYGRERVHAMDERLVKSREIGEAFGLLEKEGMAGGGRE